MLKLFSAILFISVTFACDVKAQLKKKQIQLDSNFISMADRMEVKMGFLVTGKLWNYKFGEYHLTKNKLSSKGTTQTGNFWGTKSEISSKAGFLFELSDNHQHTASVNGSIQNNITAVHEIRIAEHVYVGESGLANSRRNFLATLVMNDDTTVWRIILIEKSDSSWVGLLTDGTRNININRIYNYEDGKSPAFGISAGCELQEDGEILGAIQYFGNRYNNNVVWILNSLDQKQKCFLAAALTAIMASAHNGQEFQETAMDSQSP